MCAEKATRLQCSPHLLIDPVNLRPGLRYHDDGLVLFNEGRVVPGKTLGLFLWRTDHDRPLSIQPTKRGIKVAFGSFLHSLPVLGNPLPFGSCLPRPGLDAESR